MEAFSKLKPEDTFNPLIFKPDRYGASHFFWLSGQVFFLKKKGYCICGLKRLKWFLMVRFLFFFVGFFSVSCITGKGHHHHSTDCCPGKHSSSLTDKGHSHSVALKNGSSSTKQHEGHPHNPVSGKSSSVKHHEQKHQEHKGHSHSVPSVPEKKASSLNRVIEDLSFSPINGSKFQLSELKQPKAIVIVMREKDCPISEKYGPRLARLEKEYSNKGIEFIYNYVGQVRREESARKDLENMGFKEPYAIDSRQVAVKALSAKTTGDVFILTPERKIIYRGPMDDQFHLLKSALKPKNNYVSDILKDLVSGKNITPKELPAPGCLISPPIAHTNS